MFIGVCLHILLPTRAKSPKAAVNLDWTQAQDEDKVKINPREFLRCILIWYVGDKNRPGNCMALDWALKQR